jgi:hypothetical protein
MHRFFDFKKYSFDEQKESILVPVPVKHSDVHILLPKLSP